LRLPDRPDQLPLPVLGQVAAGVPIGADIGSDELLLLDRALFAEKPDYLLKVKGDSMRDDGIFDGDLVAVKRTGEARSGQVVVARIDGEITITRLARGRSRIRLLPRNPEHAPIEVPPGQGHALEGVDCGPARRGRPRSRSRICSPRAPCGTPGAARARPPMASRPATPRSTRCCPRAAGRDAR